MGDNDDLGAGTPTESAPLKNDMNAKDRMRSLYQNWLDRLPDDQLNDLGPEKLMEKAFNAGLEARVSEIESDMEKLTKPLSEYLTMDDISDCFKEMREKWKLDKEKV